MGADLKKLTIRHEAILEYMIANPEKPQNDVAAYFDVTPAWLSMIINSDLFQERLAGVIQQGHEVGIFSVKEKMAATASMALDRLMDRIPLETDVGELTKAANVTLKGLGYGNPKVPELPAGGIHQTNVYVASPELLQKAKDTMQAVHGIVPSPTHATEDQSIPNVIKGEAEVIHDSDSSDTG